MFGALENQGGQKLGIPEKPGILCEFRIYARNFIKLGMGRSWFSILVKRRNVVVGRFSVPPVLGKSLKTENQSKNCYCYFFCWKNPQRRSSSGIKWGKWRSHKASFVVVVYDTIQIRGKMYSPSNEPGPSTEIAIYSQQWILIAILTLPSSLCHNSLKNALYMTITSSTHRLPQSIFYVP